jgi:hypothetical protein
MQAAFMQFGKSQDALSSWQVMTQVQLVGCKKIWLTCLLPVSLQVLTVSWQWVKMSLAWPMVAWAQW